MLIGDLEESQAQAAAAAEAKASPARHAGQWCASRCPITCRARPSCMSLHSLAAAAEAIPIA